MKSSLDAPLSSMKHFWPYWWRARAVSLLTCAAFFPLRWHDSPQSNTFKPYFSESFLFAPEKMWCSSIKPYLPHSQHRISLDHLLPIPIKSLSADTAGHIRFNSSKAKRTPIYPAMCSARIVSDNFYLWYFLPNNKPSEPECPNRFNGKSVNLKSDLCEKRSCQSSDFIHIFLTYSLSCLYRPSDGQMDVLLTVSRMSVWHSYVSFLFQRDPEQCANHGVVPLSYVSHIPIADRVSLQTYFSQQTMTAFPQFRQSLISHLSFIALKNYQIRNFRRKICASSPSSWLFFPSWQRVSMRFLQPQAGDRLDPPIQIQ